MGNSTSQHPASVCKILAKRKPDIPEEVRSFDFPFENLVLEGGGCKTFAYVGGLKVLEEVGILQKVKRFAGASGGAMIACLLAVGFNTNDLYQFFSVDFEKMTEDARMGRLSLLPNLLNYYGWHPGSKVHVYIQESIKKKCGSAEYTFEQLYKEKGVELCIVASNITRMTLEYYHPKTTPKVPIAKAVRMSVSLPGFYQPVRFEHGQKVDYYVDGGMLCNFPIFAFDGWYLSMKSDDAFLRKLGQEEESFEGRNDKTIGMLVYATEESEILRKGLHKRYDNHTIKRPDTPLARKRGADCDSKLAQLKQRAVILDAAKNFWGALHDANLDRDDLISQDEFKQALEKVSKTDLACLFGEDFNMKKTFSSLDTNKDGSLTYNEFINYMDAHGVAFKEAIEGSTTPRDLNNVGDFATALIDTMGMTISRQQLKPTDISRTIGVHTDYVQTTDFDMWNKDREFMVEQAEVAVLSFLKEYMEHAGSS